MSLGFKEMFGPAVETAFWDLEALFIPQFHSARGIHDLYFVKEPKYGKIDKALLSKVRKSHEKGEGTSSKGWDYEFDEKTAQEYVLRSQGTALRVQRNHGNHGNLPPLATTVIYRIWSTT